MRFVKLASAVVLLSLASFTAAYAEDSDRVGDLLRTVKKARLIDLSHNWENDSPVAGVNPPYHFRLRDTHASSRGFFAAFGESPPGQLSFTAEVMDFSGQHGAPSIDAIGHIGRNGLLFGGVDAAQATSDPNGIGASGVGAHLGIDHYPLDLLVNRGVLLDVARMLAPKGNRAQPLPEKFEIVAKHLEDAARRQGVTLKKGDTIFIRTGWGQYFNSNNALYAGGNSPGPGLDAAAFLIKHGARVVGDDTLTFEQRPPKAVFNENGTQRVEIFPVHMKIIADSGIFIIENLNLEELSESKAYEFVVVVPPLLVKGGTGSALRAFALVPRDND